MSNIRIMSNNIWGCDANTDKWAEKGYDCSAPVRAKGFLRTYKELLPDILGLQECSGFMGKCLRRLIEDDNLPYEFLYGRDTPILYNKNKFFAEETAPRSIFSFIRLVSMSIRLQTSFITAFWSPVS